MYQTKDNKGITLIALVVTIIVLIILAGVSINLLVGNDGIITKAKTSADDYSIAAMKEKIELELMDLYAANIDNGGTITFSQIAQRLIEKGIIEDGMADEIFGQVITKDGYIVMLSQDANGKWTTETVNAVETDKIITKHKLSTEEEIIVPVQRIRLTTMQTKNGINKITLPDNTERSFNGAKQATIEEYEITQNGTYTFVIEDTKGNKENYDVTIRNVVAGIVAIVVENNNSWTATKTARVEWPLDSETLTREISIDNGTTYTAYTEPLTITDNCTIKARILTNGIVYKEAESVTISKIDKNAPSIASITLAEKLGTYGITATISSVTDSESGVNYNSSKIKYTTDSTPVGTDISAYTDGTLTGENTTLEKLIKSGTYYLHVLVQDNVGNKQEVVSDTPVTVTTVRNFDYTGAEQTITLPTGNYKLEVWGAEGGYGYTSSSTYASGKGGYSVGNINISADTNLYVLVGEKGKIGSTTQSIKTGGFNGGGDSSYTYGGSGGGATDIRIGENNLYSRVIVAGGGGRRCILFVILWRIWRRYFWKLRNWI